MNIRNGTDMGESSSRNLDERIGTIKESVKGFVDRGEERVGAIKERVLGVKDQAMTRGSAVLEQVTSFIKANPLKAVGIAFGLGFVTMRLLRR